MTLQNKSDFSDQRPLFKAYDIRGDRSLFTEPFLSALSQVFATNLLRSISNSKNSSAKNLPQNSHSAVKAVSQNNQCCSFYNDKPVHQYDDNSTTNSSLNDNNLNSSDIAYTTSVVIGYDARQLSKTIAEQFAQTLQDFGFNIIWLGLVTTPIMAYWANEYDGHGIIATASHSQGCINGIKWLFNTESPSSEDIQQLYEMLIHSYPVEQTLDSPHITNLSSDTTSSRSCSQSQHTKNSFKVLKHKQVTQKYINSAVHSINQLQSRTQAKYTPFNIVIDCLNGATGPFVHSFFSNFPNLCNQITVINDTPDGSFPKGAPDPTEPNRLSELSEAVITHNADFGLSFDGDGDRLMVVDHLGRVVSPDYLLYLLARVAIDDATLINANNSKINNNKDCVSNDNSAQSTVIFDVKCSHHLPQLIEQIGARPQMSKTGSSIMRRALQNGGSPAIFAGELSGHFMFNDGLFILHDDAMYAALRLINWLSLQVNRPHIESQQAKTQLKPSLSAHLPSANFKNSQHSCLYNKAGDNSKSLHVKNGSQSSVILASIIDSLPKMVSTSDIYLPLAPYQTDNSFERPIINKLENLCNDLQQFFNKRDSQKLKSDSNHSDSKYKFALPKNTRLTCIDGLRLDFANGFGVIRPSSTSNCLTVRFAGNSLSNLKDSQSYFVKLCQNINEDLANQIANISVTS